MLSVNPVEVPINERRHAGQATVDLWVSLYDPTVKQFSQYCSLLSYDEQERADRFKFEHHRNFYIFCRGSLRRILSRYVEQSADDLRFRYGVAGKPSLIGNSGLEFNVSHAGDLFVCAVSSGFSLGIDVEEIRPMPDLQSVATHFFSPRERAQLEHLGETDKVRAFYECWTRKEAVIKATGEGISRPLDTFDVSFGPGIVASLMRFDTNLAPSCQMQSFDPHPGYVGALISFSRWHALNVLSDSSPTSSSPVGSALLLQG